MQTVLIVIHLMVVLTMTGLILLQRSEGGGLGMGGGGGFMTNRGSTNVMTRATGVLAGVFFTTSLILSILAAADRRPASILGTGAPAGQQAPGALPPLSSGGGVLNQLQPPPPSAPQVPQSR